MDSPGNEADTASPASTDDDELTTTVAPSADIRRAVSSPIPLDEPVTMATRPLNSDMPADVSGHCRSNQDRPAGRCRCFTGVMTFLDHLVVAVPDLDAAVDLFETATGIRPEFGGVHERRGTHNALVSFGSAYLEIIAPDPGQPDPAGPRPFGIDEVAGPTLVTFAVHPPPGQSIDDVVATAREQGYDPGDPIGMHRVRPDGERLNWRLTFPEAGNGPGVIPFVIDWGSTTSPADTAPGGCELTAFDARLGPGELETTTDRLAAIDFDLPIEAGQPVGLRARIRGPRGAMEFGS